MNDEQNEQQLADLLAWYNNLSPEEQVYCGPINLACNACGTKVYDGREVCQTCLDADMEKLRVSSPNGYALVKGLIDSRAAKRD